MKEPGLSGACLDETYVFGPNVGLKYASATEKHSEREQEKEIKDISLLFPISSSPPNFFFAYLLSSHC